MKRHFYYLYRAIACESMGNTTMSTAAIAEAMKPQITAEQRTQEADTICDTTAANGAAIPIPQSSLRARANGTP